MILPKVSSSTAQEPAARALTSESMAELNTQLDRLETEVHDKLKAKGVAPDDISTERFLNLRFQGTDVALMVPGDCTSGFAASFMERYQREFGFVLQNRDIIVDDVRCAASQACISCLTYY